MTSLHANHIKNALKSEYGAHIDLDDVKDRSEEQQNQAFLTRALAALAIRELTGYQTADSADAVIDGFHDNGVDALAVDPDQPHLWVVQSKWSDKGTATFTQADALKLREGFDLLIDRDFEKFNAKLRPMQHQIGSVVTNPNVTATLVAALAGNGTISPDTRRPIDDCLSRLNAISQVVDFQVWGLREFHNIVRAGISEPTVNLEATVGGCGVVTAPYKAYYGTLPVDSVAAWYEDHGSRLFGRNIRSGLGLTTVNLELIETLTSRPDDFWYFNNGITILCDRVNGSLYSSRSQEVPRHLSLQGASVVNGAQTVLGIAEAMRRNPAAASQGRVWVRIISLEGCPADFSSDVTQATNTQNRVTKRDLTVSLDQEQIRLRDEFLMSLDKTYVFKRSTDYEVAPEEGCSVLEAAKALACAHPEVDLTVRANRDIDLLWEAGTVGVYRMIFNHRTSVFRVWRCVLVGRSVSASLRSRRGSMLGRADQVAAHGELLILHIVFKLIDMETIDNPDIDWVSDTLRDVENTVESVLRWLVYLVDAEFGSNGYVLPVFKDPKRCKILTERAVSVIRDGEQVPELAKAYSPPVRNVGRRANAVTVLINSGRIAEGTRVTFRPVSRSEVRELTPWISREPARGAATWVNDRTSPLLWEADGKQYSPSGLVMHMQRLATGETPTAVRGTSRWVLSEMGTLLDVANEVSQEEEEEEERVRDGRAH